MSLFSEKMQIEGQIMYKVRDVFARPGVRGERVVTCVDGRVISDVVIEEDTSVVVRAKSADCELYVLSREKFIDNYETSGEVELGNAPVKQILRSRGFQKYHPKPGSKKYVYEVTAEDVASVPDGFCSAWGASQPLALGDFLVSPFP